MDRLQETTPDCVLVRDRKGSAVRFLLILGAGALFSAGLVWWCTCSQPTPPSTTGARASRGEPSPDAGEPTPSELLACVNRTYSAARFLHVDYDYHLQRGPAKMILRGSILLGPSGAIRWDVFGRRGEHMDTYVHDGQSGWQVEHGFPLRIVKPWPSAPPAFSVIEWVFRGQLPDGIEVTLSRLQGGARKYVLSLASRHLPDLLIFGNVWLVVDAASCRAEQIRFTEDDPGYRDRTFDEASRRYTFSHERHLARVPSNSFTIDFEALAAQGYDVSAALQVEDPIR